jgi:hypothetical protein
VRRETRASPEIFFRRLAHPRQASVATAMHRCDRTIEHARMSMRFRKPLK